MREVRRVATQVAEDSPLLDVALGLLSMISSFDAILEEHVPSKAVHASIEDEREATEFILGLLSFRSRTLVQLGVAADTFQGSEEPRAETFLDIGVLR